MCPGECIGQKEVLPPETGETTQFITEEGSAVVQILKDLSLNNVTPIALDQGCHNSWLRKQGGGTGAPLPFCGTLTARVLVAGVYDTFP